MPPLGVNTVQLPGVDRVDVRVTLAFDVVLL